MKIKNILVILTASLLLLAPTSCKDDFLYLEPHGSLSNELVFNSVEDFETALMGVYAGLRSGSYYGSNFVHLGDIMTDNCYARSGFTNSYGYVHTWNVQSGQGEFQNFFAAAYRVIARASNVLNYSEDFTTTTAAQAERLKQVRAEAFFARALAHFDLLRVYAPRFNPATAATDLGVPVVTTATVGTPARATVAKVYEQIFSDMTKARENMATVVWPGSGRFTPTVADAFLSRVHLYRGEWQQAINYANNVIEKTESSSATIKLIDSQAGLRDMYRTDSGTEILFQLSIANLTESPGAIGTEYIGSQPGIRIGPNYLITPELASLYDPFNDRRFLALIKTNVLLVNTNLRGIITLKYEGRSGLAHGVNTSKPFMLAEMYLNKAEAHAMKGGEDTQANSALNALLSARINNYVDQNLSGEALVNAIRLERRKELAFEGHYLHDLKRWGIGFSRFANVLSNFPNDLIIEPNDYRWLWPIPQHEINANKNMVQNPGY
jgi:starch-binding outer membrane protein, SusD/RagB family